MPVIYNTWHDIPKALRETLYAHEVVRAAGVPADDIYVVIQKGEMVVWVKTQGKEYAFGISTCPYKTEEEFGARWAEAVEMWDSTEDEWDFRHSTIYRNAPYILLRMAEHGIKLQPGGWN